MADSLNSFLEEHHLTLPGATAHRWRRVILEERLLCHLRGQDFQGEVVPEATDGIHAFVRTMDQRILLVMADNVIYINWNSIRPDKIAPKKKQLTLAEAQETTRTRTSKTEKLLSDFF